jgi:histone-lysine N-methyltransferase SUV420H
VEAGLIENTRKPGDYVRSDALLSAKYSKWVECNTCDDVFVQQNGYQTRKECPRCERHSKLYGFVWPKTDKEGKHDKEERILDHRIVNRFVNPGEEKTIRKTKRSLRDAIVERYSTPRSDFRESSISTIEPDSGRRGRRVRKTM